jgi:hypothetical protein
MSKAFTPIARLDRNIRHPIVLGSAPAMRENPGRSSDGPLGCHDCV